MCVKMVVAKTGEEFIVSDNDYDRVVAHEWRLWDGYPDNLCLGSLHQFIIGERPSDVPDNYVIDHANRDVLDARRSNLRWVSKSWNAFNVSLRVNTTSRFKGVSWMNKRKRWIAIFRGTSLGTFTEEREAAKAYAKRAVEYWPKWAPSSDLLVGPHLLTQEEMDIIVANLDDKESTRLMTQRVLPVGVQPSGKKFRAIFCRKNLGTFDTSEEAGRVYSEYKIQVTAEKWAAHTKTTIVRDDEGDAIIALSGAAAAGKFTKVPDRFWHRLTFDSKWNLRGPYAAGTFDGINNYLHIFVYGLCHPGEPITGSVDHVDPAAKLNNLQTNLRDATQDVQAHNKQKKANCTSKYVGVYCNSSTGKWIGRVSIKRTRYLTKWMETEHQAALALDAIKAAKL